MHGIFKEYWRVNFPQPLPKSPTEKTVKLQLCRNSNYYRIPCFMTTSQNGALSDKPRHFFLFFYFFFYFLSTKII